MDHLGDPLIPCFQKVWSLSILKLKSPFFSCPDVFFREKNNPRKKFTENQPTLGERLRKDGAWRDVANEWVLDLATRHDANGKK